MKVKSGFTLIELMVVLLIMGVLLAMLLPAINAAIIYFKIKDTENRITLLSGCIEQYKQVFGEYPPSHFNTISIGNSYTSLTPSTWFEPVTKISHALNFVDTSYYHNDTQPLGGGFLYYFLLGPNQAGWSATDSTVCDPLVAANWPAPDALTQMITNQPVISPYPSNGSTTGAGNHAMYYFEDGFGCDGHLDGTILYSLRLNRTMKWPGSATLLMEGTFYSKDLDGAYMVSSSLFSAPGQGGPSWQRLTSQCRTPYLLLSAGPDGLFGYIITDPTTGLKRGVRPTDPDPLTSGLSDDITNFSHN